MKVTSEGPIKITKATIEAVWRRRKKDHRLIIRDKDCRGLFLIVNATSMAWTYAFRPRGADPATKRRWPSKTMTLGNTATHSPDDARTEANRIKGRAAAGADPAAEKKTQAEEALRKRGGALGRLLDEYGRALPKRPKMRGSGIPSPAYVAGEIAQATLAITAMDAKETPAADLGLDDIRKLLADDEANPRGRFGALSRFLDWCQDVGHIPANPCHLVARTRRPKAPQPRSHYLTPAELARLWKAAEALDEQVWRDFARFLIAVPCRRGEAAALEWSHLDLGAAEWRQPGKLTKNRDPHRLFLTPLALEVLAARRRAAAEFEGDGDAAKTARILATGAPRSGLVFPAPQSRDEIDTFSAIKSDLADATAKDGDPKITGWTWHDFRRSFATALGEAGTSEAVADAVLNHRQSATRGGVLGVYQRASRWPEQVRAMELWGRMLADAINPPGGADNVVPIAARMG